MEGPSLILLSEEVAFLKGREITSVTTTAGIDPADICKQSVKNFLSHGKHFLIVLDRVTIRIHFLMFGSYRINEEKERLPKLSLKFGSDVLNFYACAVKLLYEDVELLYDWTIDVMSPLWSERKARNVLRKIPHVNVGDALLNQEIFAGVGNIIKNEVLFRIQVHPENHIGALPPRKLSALVREARQFSFDFYEWKKIFQLRKHLLIYKKKKCRRCDLPVLVDHTGKVPRLSFYCANCQYMF
jgi:endonuclease VIII